MYIINGDIEYYADITDGSKPKDPIFIYDIPEKIKENTTHKTTSKTSEQSTFINFNYGIAGSTKSGCTINKYNHSSGTYTTTDAGVYGANPAPQENGYLVRGTGLPHHNLYYNGLFLQATNKEGFAFNPRSGQTLKQDLSTGSTISIEYPFKANVTYEISLVTYFADNMQLIDRGQSTGFPIVHVQLKDSGILAEGDIACEKDLIRLVTEENYIKSYTLESKALMTRTLIFKFSPTNAKNAVAISLHPARGDERSVNAIVPINNYTMIIRSVNITEKPFDPSLNVTTPRPSRR